MKRRPSFYLFVPIRSCQPDLPVSGALAALRMYSKRKGAAACLLLPPSGVDRAETIPTPRPSENFYQGVLASPM